MWITWTELITAEGVIGAREIFDGNTMQKKMNECRLPLTNIGRIQGGISNLPWSLQADGSFLLDRSTSRPGPPRTFVNIAGPCQRDVQHRGSTTYFAVCRRLTRKRRAPWSRPTRHTETTKSAVPSELLSETSDREGSNRKTQLGTAVFVAQEGIGCHGHSAGCGI